MINTCFLCSMLNTNISRKWNSWTLSIIIIIQHYNIFIVYYLIWGMCEGVCVSLRFLFHLSKFFLFFLLRYHPSYIKYFNFCHSFVLRMIDQWVSWPSSYLSSALEEERRRCRFTLSSALIRIYFIEPNYFSSLFQKVLTYLAWYPPSLTAIAATTHHP